MLCVSGVNILVLVYVKCMMSLNVSLKNMFGGGDVGYRRFNSS